MNVYIEFYTNPLKFLYFKNVLHYIYVVCGFMFVCCVVSKCHDEDIDLTT